MRVVYLFVFTVFLYACVPLKLMGSAKYDAFIVCMVGSSTTSPVMACSKSTALTMVCAYAKAKLHINEDSVYSLKANAIADVVGVIVNAPDVAKSKGAPFFVIHLLRTNGDVSIYSFSRETLAKLIPLVSPDVGGGLQLMYDRSNPN